MSEHETLVKAFQQVESTYRELLAKMVELNIPGTFDLDKVAAQCSYGEACHGGTTSNPLAKRINPQSPPN